MGENEKRALSFAKALSTPFYFPKENHEDSDSDEDDWSSAWYLHIWISSGKSLQINFIDKTRCKMELISEHVLFMSINKLYMLLLLMMFIKFFVIQISYHGI